MGDYARKAPVTDGDAAELFETSAEEIMGWMIGRYRDYTGQVREMLASWREGKS